MAKSHPSVRDNPLLTQYLRHLTDLPTILTVTVDDALNVPALLYALYD